MCVFLLLLLLLLLLLHLLWSNSLARWQAGMVGEQQPSYADQPALSLTSAMIETAVIALGTMTDGAAGLQQVALALLKAITVELLLPHRTWPSALMIATFPCNVVTVSHV
jgi:hypothetical protein